VHSAEISFSRVYLCLSVYPIRTDCLCLIDSSLFTFVYVNDGCIHDKAFDHSCYGSLMVQPDGMTETIGVDLFVGH